MISISVKSKNCFGCFFSTKFIMVITFTFICSAMSALVFWIGTPAVPPGTGTSMDPFESIEFALKQIPANEYCVQNYIPGSTMTM